MPTKASAQLPVITSRIYGGLGNQCFMYAAARALADRVQGSLILDPSVLALDKTYHRRFLLSDFRIRTTRIIHKASFWKLQLKRLHFRIRSQTPWSSKRWLFERAPATFQPEVVNWRNGYATLDGYWQTERYFVDAAGAVAADLTPHNAPELEATEAGRQITATEQSVFVHVRSYREVPGQQDGSFALPSLYFEKAMTLLLRQVPTAHFFLFSDEPSWSRDRLKLPSSLPWTPISHGSSSMKSPLLDFHLMSLCRHAIVANSSFSWWAAWLGERRNQRQGRPGFILRPAEPTLQRDYFPERWTQVAFK